MKLKDPLKDSEIVTDQAPVTYAAGLLLRQVRESRISSVGHGDDVLTGLCVAA